jgi:acylglycerol lipase
MRDDYREFLLKTDDFLELYTQSWRAENSIGVIVIVHGYAEHSSRYQWAASQLVNQGFTVYTFDLRGHGKSSGARHMVRFEHYLKDLAAFLEHVGSEESNKPLFLMGHSLGGVIAALFSIKIRPSLDGLILSSSFLGGERKIPGLLLQLVTLVSRLVPTLPTVLLDAQTISRDPKVVKAYKEDPLIGHKRIAVQTLAEIFGAINEVQFRAPEIELPLLVLHGVADRLASVEGSKKIYSGVSSKDNSIKLYDGMHHELLNEPEKSQVLSDIGTWLREHLPVD